ncbi:MAG: hypothetical protein GF335_01180 [Candidatus Moranbacteria bacterium]|nr:hypothetical protein [Candidatus Moranbacteria bacterium]
MLEIYEILIITIVFFLTIAVIFLFIKKPKLPIYLMFFFMPFLFLRLEYQTYQLSVADLIGLLGFLAWSIHFLWQFLNKQTSFKALIFPSWPWYFLFILFCGLSILNSFDQGISLEYFLRNIVFSYLIYLFYPINIIKTKQSFFKIINLIFISTSLAAFLSIFYFQKEIAGVIPRITPKEILGIAPLGYNHNPVAESMLVGAFFSFLLFLKEKKNPNKQKIVLLFTLLQLLILILTFSRSAWLALILGVFVYILLEYRKYLKKIILISLIITLILSPLIYLMLKLSTSSIASASDQKRLFFIEKSLELFNYHPIIGSGIGTFKEEILHNRFYIMEFGESGTNEAHGVIWKLLGETGILGVLAYFSVLFVLGLQLLKAKTKSLTFLENHLFSLLLSLLISLTFFQLFQTNYFNQKMWLPISLMFLAVLLFKSNFKKIRT